MQIYTEVLEYTIRQVRALSETETRSLFNWGEDVFNASDATVTFGGEAETHFIMEVNGKPVCHVGTSRREVEVDAQTVVVAALGGVITRPEAQGRGYARRLIGHAVEFGQSRWNATAGMLFCLPHMIPYYGRLGWNQLETPVLIQQPQGIIAAPCGVFVHPLGNESWPNGVVQINSLPW